MTAAQAEAVSYSETVQRVVLRRMVVNVTCFRAKRRDASDLPEYEIHRSARSAGLRCQGQILTFGSRTTSEETYDWQRAPVTSS